MNIKRLIFVVAIGVLLCVSIYAKEENYSREIQQAIRLYEEGKNSDAMDRFMDILISGTPEEKSIANEYISKITNGVLPISQKNMNKDITIVDKNSNSKTNEKSNRKSISSEIGDQDLVSQKVSDKMKQLKNDILISLYRKNFIRLYMDESNQKPNYILLKEDKIFNEDMTFKQNIMGDMKAFGGLIAVLGRVTITIIPNGAISGNMKISNIRRASIIHSFLTSFGISPNKIKLDMVGSTISVSKKIDDLDGILFIFNYEKEPELISYDTPQPLGSIAIYPEIVDLDKDDASIVEFSVIMGKNPITSWKITLAKKDNIQRPIAVQKLEGTQPLISQILFNGRKKFIGDYYEPGEYEFLLDISDAKGNNVFVKKSIYIQGKGKRLAKTVLKDDTKDTITPNTQTKSQTKNITKDIASVFYKIYFDPNTFNITKNSLEKLDMFIEDYKKYPKSKIIIIGYSYNKELKPKTAAYKRANAVKNFLIKKYKINKNKIIMNSSVLKIKKQIVEIKLK